MSQVERLDGVTEARPGNYALYDYMQVVLQSCTVRDCAATVWSSVVSAQADAQHSIVDAGALALSKDPGSEHAPHPSMGAVFKNYGRGMLDTAMRVTSVSQEHGFLNATRPVGSQVRILPNHSCLTVAHFDEFHVVRGEELVDQWKIWRGRS